MPTINNLTLSKKGYQIYQLLMPKMRKRISNMFRLTKEIRGFWT